MQKIVDSHIHFWSDDTIRRPWLADVPPINHDHLPQHLLTQTGSYDLDKIVFVQAGAHPDDAIAEVKWVSNLAKDEPRIRAIVADAPMERGITINDHLEQLARYPLVKGVRRLIQGERPGFATQPAFIEAVRQLPDWGYSFDICIFHHQLDEILSLVAACPRVSFVLDHFGKPAIKDGLIEPWAAQISQLAHFPNVHCKLSGLITEADHTNWTPADLQPYIDHVISAFSPDRLMYGGDWPVSLLASNSWHNWVDVAVNAISGLSAESQQKILHQNAINFYRLT